MCRWPWIPPPPSQRRARVLEGLAVWRTEMSVYIFSSGIALLLAVLPLAGSGRIPIGHRPGWLISPVKGPARPEIGESGVPLQGLWDFLLSTDEPGADHLHTATTATTIAIFTKCSTISLEGTSKHLRRDTGSCCSGCVGSLMSLVRDLSWQLIGSV